jgi:NAD(P)-dependent dehydrogenase (short-subunit alcohol dehydrogenase family)
VADLTGKRALVTGAGVGIGQGIAVELARCGASVAAHFPPAEDHPKETLAEIEGLPGAPRAVAVRGDLRKVSECERVVEEAADALGGLDVLVNNAGVTRALPFLQTEEAHYDEMFELNVKGYFFCTKSAVPYMLGAGSIVNISSIHGHGGFPHHAAYAATKGAVDAFTRQLAVELAESAIRVNAVAPGLIEVPRYFQIPDYTTEFGGTLVPLGRIGSPPDVARAVAFFASDSSDFVTGQTVYVDGGTSARMGLWWEQGDDQF